MSDLTHRGIPIPDEMDPFNVSQAVSQAWTMGVDAAIDEQGAGKAEWRAAALATDELAKSRADEIFRLQGVSADLREQVTARDIEIEHLRKVLEEKDAAISRLWDSGSPSRPQQGDRVTGLSRRTEERVTGVVLDPWISDGYTMVLADEDYSHFQVANDTIRRVYNCTSPEPPSDVTALRDQDGDVWQRVDSGGWRFDLVVHPWVEVVRYFPQEFPMIEHKEGDND